MKIRAVRWIASIICASCALAPADENDLRFWLENMVWYHNYTIGEMTKATGLPKAEIERALRKFGISPGNRPGRGRDAPILVLPYPGGRHPRIGFLEGAVNPMRGTKFSAFLPRRDSAYVVVDLPEAIWANGELIFLAHTHIPTVWDQRGIRLENIDWKRMADGSLTRTRALPDGVRFGARVIPQRGCVDMELWIENGSSTTLKAIRAQICVMLKGAPGFNALTNENKIFSGSVVGVRSADAKRWIVTAWQSGKVWANAKVPCMHSDPQFSDCPPGKRVSARGRLLFYEGRNIEAQIKQLEKLGSIAAPR